MTFWLLIRQTRYRSAHEKEKRNNKNSGLRYACNKVPWSKGQDTGLSSRRYWVQVPWGSLRLLSLKVRTPASQAGDVGFKSRRSYCGHRTVAVKRTQFALQICGSAHGGARCPGDICSAPTEAERRPIPPGHPMDGYAQRRGQRTVNPLQRNTAGSSPAPSTLRLRVRVVYGAILLRWCAATHRRFKSFRKRS